MSDFTAKKLKEARTKSGLSLDEASERMKISRRRLGYIESNNNQPTSDEIVEFAKLYKVDVRELLLESYAEESEEQILCNRYISLCRLYDQLSTKDKEDVFWVIKQRIAGLI